MSAWDGFDFGIHAALGVARERLIALHEAKRGAVVLAGRPGCGKSHMARAVARAWGLEAVFISEPDLMQFIKSGYASKDTRNPLTRYRKAKLLALDDVGVAHIKAESVGWLREQYWQIFDAREDKATIITTNMDLVQLGERLGSRALSRLMGMMGSKRNYVDLFAVKDYRMRNW